jgi:DNA helicase II / ATP-dependent DNA helicase PcrA
VGDTPNDAAGHTPTAEQQAVIDARDGTVLVLAAVGSGKTSTLARRIAALLEHDGVAPGRALAVTFTNRAASHMRTALARTVGKRAAQQVHLGTFHALCADILRSGAGEAGLPPDLRVIDEDDADEVLAELGAHTPTKARYRLHADAADVADDKVSVEAWHAGQWSRHPAAADYAQALTAQGAVDFAGLVYLARALLLRDESVRAAWAGRFDAVMVDEVQDTHPSEFAVLRILAQSARSRCFVGDLDQTIYSWRGSAPQALLDQVRADLGPARELSLTASFRATHALVEVADTVASDMPARASQVRPADGLDPGTPPRLLQFGDEEHEHVGVAHDIAQAIAAGALAKDCAVLARSNREVVSLAAAFARANVPCTTVEQLRYFRRAEVKDALALARLVVNPADEGAARRAARRLVRAADADTLRALRVEGRPVGLRVADLLDPACIAGGDPLAGLDTSDVVVLDTETTGLDPTVDEVIELAAVRMRDGIVSEAPSDRLELLLKNTVPVGNSADVHGITDARLAADGLPPAEALAQLRDFIGASPIAGHNVAFDQAMLLAHGRRVGVEMDLAIAWDTLPAARRLIAAPRHTLGTLVDQLGLAVTPTHRAMDDVLATAALMVALRPRAHKTAARRRALITQFAPTFARLRGALARWAGLSLRAGDLVQVIIDEALAPMVRRDPRRSAGLAELPARLAALDDTTELAVGSPSLAVQRVLDRATLTRDVDALDAADGARIITVHQSKGLEFERVWVPGLVDGGLPSFRSIDDEDALNEERRVFYVAITRARRHLTLTWHAQRRFGRIADLSRFVEPIRSLCVEPAPPGPSAQSPNVSR